MKLLRKFATGTGQFLFVVYMAMLAKEKLGKVVTCSSLQMFGNLLLNYLV